jgi:hypothetical protein
VSANAGTGASAGERPLISWNRVRQWLHRVAGDSVHDRNDFGEGQGHYGLTTERDLKRADLILANRRAEQRHPECNTARLTVGSPLSRRSGD